MSMILKRSNDPERAQSRRTQVLDAAAICFARSGFHAASMAQISKEAGMSAGHIYNYFENKDAIIMAFVAMRVEHVTNRLCHVGKQDDPLEYMFEEIEEIVDEHLDPGLRSMTMEIYAEAARNPVIASALQAADATARGQLNTLIQRGRAQRGLAADDATVKNRTEAMAALFNGLPMRALHHPGLDRNGLVAAVSLVMKALMMT